MPQTPLKVLIVDDEPSVVHALEVLLDINGIPCAKAADPEEALRLLQQDPIGAILQDMNFGADKTSGEEGIRLFHRIRDLEPEIPVLLMTAWASLEKLPPGEYDLRVEVIPAGSGDKLREQISFRVAAREE